MRVCENGVYRDATPEEIAEFERIQKENKPPETPEARIAALEGELKAAKILLGLEE